MSYIYLFSAIIFEVIGTMLIPLSKNFTKPFFSIVLIIAYMLSFYLFSFALKEIPIAVAYSTWAGLGIFLITLFSYIVHDQSLGWQSILGLLLIAMGVALVNTFKNQNIL